MLYYRRMPEFLRYPFLIAMTISFPSHWRKKVSHNLDPTDKWLSVAKLRLCFDTATEYVEKHTIGLTPLIQLPPINTASIFKVTLLSLV